MSKRNPRLYLEDIVEAINKIERYTAGMTLDVFSETDMAVDAVIRNIEVIGEAIKNLPAETKALHNEVPWQQIVDTRNKIIHEYFGVDLSILWHSVQEEIPTLKRQVMQILEDLK